MLLGNQAGISQTNTRTEICLKGISPKVQSKTGTEICFKGISPKVQTKTSTEICLKGISPKVQSKTGTEICFKGISPKVQTKTLYFSIDFNPSEAYTLTYVRGEEAVVLQETL